MDQPSIETTQLLERFLLKWPSIILLVVVGAAVAFGISALLPARYEAAAAIAVSVDFGRIVDIDLVTEDRILDRVWQLMISDETLTQVRDRLIASYGATSDWESVDSLRKKLRLDARLARWEMIAIDPDPGIASAIANVWQQVNLERLEDAIDHAWRAISLQGVRFDVGCVLLLTNENEDAIYHCVAAGPEISQDALETLKGEIAASHGIIPVIQFEAVHEAVPPEHPVLWPRGLLIFSGGMMGFLIGCLIFLNPVKLSLDDLNNHA